MSEVNLGLDRSGNNNHFAVVNMTLAADQVLDSPTNNFSTMNPLANANSSAGSHDSDSFTVSEGNLKTRTAGAADGRILNTIMPITGKWYFEFVVTEVAESNRAAVSVGEYDSHLIGQEDQAGDHYMLALGAAGGDRLWYYGNEKDDYNYTTAVGDVWQFAFDITGTTHKIWIRQNAENWFGTNSATFASGSPAQSQNKSSINTVFYVSHAGTSGSASSASTVIFNFGQDSSFAGNKTSQGNQDANGIGDFFYTPPTGFLALCTNNLPEPTVDPRNHFNTVLYTGNGNDNRAITGVGFQPDWVWIKGRSNGESTAHDSLRGPANALFFESETAEDTGGNLVSFDSDGFTTSDSNRANANNRTLVAWNWKAGGNAASVGSNTDGSINTTDTSVNSAAGFSISTFTGNATSGATVGHGLGVVPEWVMVVCRSTAGNRFIYHASNTSAPATDYLALETTGATADHDGIWNDTAPTSSVFSLGNNASANGNNETFVAYCFHSVEGYSKFGSYTGNGNADGPFVHTGFQPAFLLTKRTDTGDNWRLTDNAREPFNDGAFAGSKANATDSEGDTGNRNLDYLSNGFKVRDTDVDMNADGGNYIYMAFAEIPFKHSNAR